MLSVGRGLNVNPNSPCFDHDPSDRVSYSPRIDQTTGLRSSPSISPSTDLNPGPRIIGPPRVSLSL